MRACGCCGSSAGHRVGSDLAASPDGAEFLRTVDLLLDLHDSSAFALDNPLQRFWRDLNVGACHAQLSTYLTTENHGLLVTGAGAPVQVG